MKNSSLKKPTKQGTESAAAKSTGNMGQKNGRPDADAPGRGDPATNSAQSKRSPRQENL